jgi:DNA repair protein RecO (recombination protein O)
MLVKTRAIVLHYVKYSESSIIACLYTEKFGRQSYMINAVRTRRPVFPASFFLPLTLLEVDVYFRPGRELQRAKEITCILHFQTIPFQVIKSTIALFIAELLYKTLKEEEANPTLFDFLIHAIQLLDIKEEGIPNYHLVFLLDYMKFLGIYPFQSDRKGYHEDQSVFILPPETGAGEKKGFEQLIHSSLAELGKIKLTNKTRSFLLDRIMEFYSVHLDHITGIRSLQVLKEVFQ